MNEDKIIEMISMEVEEYQKEMQKCIWFGVLFATVFWAAVAAGAVYFLDLRLIMW